MAVDSLVLASSVVLEAFGNAMTRCNDNSSRFAKYAAMLFARGAMVGCTLSTLLLEKSRVVSQRHGERNFHVFYHLLAGLSAREKLALFGVRWRTLLGCVAVWLCGCGCVAVAVAAAMCRHPGANVVVLAHRTKAHRRRRSSTQPSPPHP